MTDELDTTRTTDESRATHDDRNETRATDTSAASPGPEESIGVTIPDAHVGAFVAQAFEDVERSTEWEDAIDAVVADEAREAWESLSLRRQVVELLTMADEFDSRATEAFEAIPLDQGCLDGDDRERFEDAKRLRRNADILRDGIAAGYAEGRVSDDELIDAIEAFEFDTARIADREDAIDAVASAYDLEFRPYGGTLMTEQEPNTDAETIEAW